MSMLPPSEMRMFLDSVKGVIDEFAILTAGASHGSESIIGRLRSDVHIVNEKLRGLVDDYEKRQPIYPQSKRTASQIRMGGSDQRG